VHLPSFTTPYIASVIFSTVGSESENRSSPTFGASFQQVRLFENAAHGDPANRPRELQRSGVTAP